MKMYYCLSSFFLDIYCKSLAQYLAKPRSVRIIHATRISLVNVSYVRNGTTLTLVSLKDLESDFLSLLSGLNGFISAVFLLGDWFDRQPSYG